MQQIELLHPNYLLLLPLFLLLMWLLKRYYSTVAFSNVKLVKKALKRQLNIAKWLRFLIVAVIVLALSSPAIKHTSKAKDTLGYDISLLLDASYSMQEQNRFTKAKAIISQFIKERKEDNIALTLFANHAYVASPLTHEKASLLKMLEYLKLGVAGGRDTALYEALFLGANLFKKSSHKNRVMVLLTDGLNTVKGISLQSALQQITNNHIRVYTIALGKEGDYNAKVLSTIAKKSGGKFFEALNPNELELIYGQINALERAKIKTKTITNYHYYIQYFVIAALILLLLYLLLYYHSLSLPFTIAALFLLIYTSFKPTLPKEKTLNNRNGGEFAIALDLSNAMEAKDIYPNRLAFAKAKINQILNLLHGQKVALFGFSNKPYLISPATNDYERLHFLVNNLQPNGISRDGSKVTPLVKAIKQVSQSKSVILFSATDFSDTKEAIEFLKKSAMQVNIYAVATKRGDAVRVDGKFLKEHGEIKIFRLNSNVQKITFGSGGVFRVASLDDTMQEMLKRLKLKSATSVVAKNSQKPNTLPLLIALLAFVAATLRRRA